MSQLTHPLTSVRSHATVVIAALLALAATAAVVLVLAIGGSSENKSTGTPVSSGSQPGVRYDGGPEEGSSLAKPAPSVRYDGGPNEGSAAGSISGR